MNDCIKNRYIHTILLLFMVNKNTMHVRSVLMKTTIELSTCVAR